MPSNSTRKRPRSKSPKRPEKPERPPKPFESFELYPHPLGYWSKKIGGRILHFGRWGRTVNGVVTPLDDYDAGWKEALKTYRDRGDDAKKCRIKSFVVPEQEEVDDETLTVVRLADRFLVSRHKRLTAKVPTLSPRSFKEWREVCDLIVGEFGRNRPVADLTPDDFATLYDGMAKRWGPARLGKFVALIRAVFRHASDNALIERPVNFGSEFSKPDKATMRKTKADGGKKLFTRDEALTILAALNGDEVQTAPDKKTGKRTKVKLPANLQLRAATLLALNAGLGNSDIANLEYRHIDFESRWLTYARGKTAVGRRNPLWQETCDAILAAADRRPAPKSKTNAECVFLNRFGGRLVQSTIESHSDYVSKQFGKLLRTLKINGRRGLNFYALRHTAATVALQTGDRDAAKAMMGHLDQDTISLYDEDGPSSQRLLAISDHIRDWLFGDEN